MSFKESNFIYKYENDIEPMLFKTYIPLKSNNQVLSRCKKISEDIKKNKKTKPLLITSACGSGKTHLLQSIYAEVRNLNSILFYAQAFHHYQRKHRLQEFYQFLCSHDIILIDDLSLLLERSRPNYMQKEVIHYVIKLLNHFHQNNKPLVAASCFNHHPDTSDQKLKLMFKELTFLTANEVVIHSMSYDEKVTFLLQKSKYTYSIVLPDKKIIEIVNNAQNTRDLIGSLHRIITTNRKSQLGLT